MPDEQPPGVDEPSPDPDPGAATDGAAEGAAAEDAAAERRTLCRSSTDKVIAGVAGGIGAYFGIDAVIVRIAFIVLTFLGGAGPFLYLIGWLALPTEDSRSIVAKALGGDSPHRFRSLMAVVLIGLGLLITANLSGNLFGLFIDVWKIAPYLALILIAAGVALVLWPGPARRPESTPARPPAPPPPGTPPPSSAYATGAPPPPTAAGPEWPPLRVEAPARPRRGRSLIGSLTVAALFVYTGTAVMLDRLDAVDVDFRVFFAVALAITGAGLLASAFARPARGLIVLGVALSAPLLLFVAVDVPGGSGIGEARVRVVDVEELEDEYRHGIGQLTVDLRDLDPERTDHSVDLSLGIGEMLVYVPDSIATTADINVGAGNIRVWYGGPAPDRIQVLRDVRGLLEGLRTLHGDGDLDDLEGYLEAFERRSGVPITPEQRQSVTGLFAGVSGPEDLRSTLVRLINEARGVGYPWEDSEDGLGIGRTITVPVWGEHEGELRLDIDVGIGEARLITGPAPVEVSDR